MLDETALLTCMAYVDLNPIRAKLATTPETSGYTYIKQRIEAKLFEIQNRQPTVTSGIRLLGFAVEVSDPEQELAIPMFRDEYLEWVDWTGRVIRQDRKGAIPEHIAPILQRIHLNEKQWLQTAQHVER